MSEETELERAKAALAAVEAEVEATWRKSLELQAQLAPLLGSTDPEEIMRANALREAMRRLRDRLPNPDRREGEPPTTLQNALDRARERVRLVEKQIDQARAEVERREALAAQAEEWREMRDLARRLLALGNALGIDALRAQVGGLFSLAGDAVRDLEALDGWRERLRRLGG